MQFNQDQIAAIIGQKELERIALTHALAQAQARIAELEAMYEPKESAKPELKAVDAS